MISLSPANTVHVRQALKTALAALLCLLLTRALHLPEGYWSAISAIIVLQSHVGGTLNASLNRLAGTAVGATVAAIFVSVFGSHPLSFAGAVAVTLLMCVFLRVEDSSRLAGSTVAIIMLVVRDNPVWVVALHRFTEVAVGIFMALLVSTVVWPSQARVKLRQGLAEEVHLLSELFSVIVWPLWSTGPGPKAAEDVRVELGALVRRNDTLWQQAQFERAASLAHHDLLVQAMTVVRRFRVAVDALQVAATEEATDAVVTQHQPEFSNLLNAIAQQLNDFANRIRSAEPRVVHDPAVLQAADALEAKALDARKSVFQAGYPLDRMMRFHATVLSLLQLARDIDEGEREMEAKAAALHGRG